MWGSGRSGEQVAGLGPLGASESAVARVPDGRPRAGGPFAAVANPPAASLPGGFKRDKTYLAQLLRLPVRVGQEMSERLKPRNHEPRNHGARGPRSVAARCQKFNRPPIRKIDA